MKKLQDYGTEPLEIVNARITSAKITFDRDIFLSCWLMLGYEGAGQGYGGYVLGGAPSESKNFSAGDHANQPNLAAHWIAHVMAIGEVTDFSNLTGKVIRVAKDSDKFNAKIVGIGHAIEDKWFFQEQEFAALRDRRE
jgi:hypothetical protein